MKLYISSDMEGVAGVCSWEQVDARTPHPEYAIYRKYYTHEVCSAIEGARAAGVGDVLVNDSHGPMRNLVLDDIPADVRVLFGNRKPHSMVQDADPSFGGAFFVGYHGAIGAADAVLCHTYTPSVIYDVSINGVRCSEATLNAALLGHVGVPVLLVTGDRTTVEGVREQMPWVQGVVVKESIGTFAATSLTPAAAQRAIRDGARAAIENAPAAKPFRFDSPVQLEITLAKTEQADLVEMIPGFARMGPRAVRFEHVDYPVVFRAFVATWRLGALA
ncbi:MAG TPA: M55 family metallopeptidase [Candidatus Baltobacteraceae bacterium]|nr:M55 family metallopeptidase [Candidatus Baltobacteraceae bacterium]